LIVFDFRRFDSTHENFMYLTVIAWMYVVLMMSVAEATSTTGTVLGAFMTFVLYGALPLSLVVYLMGTPARRRAIKAREKAEATAVAESAKADPPAPFPPHSAAGPSDPSTATQSHPDGSRPS
jgi:hypothetical protein